MSSNNEINDVFFIPSELDDASLKELLTAFLDEIRNDFVLLNNSFKVADIDQVKISAHKIKGTAACYGAELVSNNALDLENSITKEKNIKNCVISLGDSIERTSSFAEATFGI